MNKQGIRFYVSGKVQGVWFRSSTKDQAVLLGLTGYAKNLPDGRVEVLAFGEIEKLEALKNWLKEGPRLAKVDEVIVEMCEYKTYPGFDVL